MNGTRLTVHHHIKRFVGASPENSFFFLRNIVAAGLAGIIGSAIGSPLYLIKVGFYNFSFLTNRYDCNLLVMLLPLQLAINTVTLV